MRYKLDWLENGKIEKLVATISKGAAQSWQMENRYKTMAAGKFDFGFAVDWMGDGENGLHFGLNNAYDAAVVDLMLPGCDGLSVIDMAGQWRGPSSEISRERSKMLVVIVFDAPAHLSRVQAIVDAYLKRFRQREVLRTERAVCAG